MTKQESPVWLFLKDSPPVKFKRPRSTSKQIIVFFFAKSGQAASVPLQERKMVIAEWYINICPPVVFEARSARTLSKQRHPLPVIPPRPRKSCSHRRHHPALPGSKSHSACHPNLVFPGLSRLGFFFFTPLSLFFPCCFK